MTTYVDPHHVTVIVEKAREDVRYGCDCVITFDPDVFDPCLAHLTLGLLQPTVTAYEPPL